MIFRLLRIPTCHGNDTTIHYLPSLWSPSHPYLIFLSCILLVAQSSLHFSSEIKFSLSLSLSLSPKARLPSTTDRSCKTRSWQTNHSHFLKSHWFPPQQLPIPSTTAQLKILFQPLKATSRHGAVYSHPSSDSSSHSAIAASASDRKLLPNVSSSL